jgi:hypothetical protein
VSAIGAVGREALGGVDELEDVGIVVGADPAEEIELEVAFDGVGEERGEFERAELEIDAGAAPLVLESGADEAELLVGGSFQRDVDTGAVAFARKAGRVEQLFGASGIERVLGEVGFVGPMIGRENAGGDASLAVQEVANEGFAVGGESQGLTDFRVGEDRVVEVDAEIGEIGAGALGDGEGGLFGEDGNHVGGKGADLDVSRTFAELQSANDSVRDDTEADAGELRCPTEVNGVALDDDFVVLGLADEAERPGADGIAGEICGGVGWGDADGWANEIRGEGSVRLFEVEDDRGIVSGFDRCDHAESAALGGAIGGIHDEPEGGFHVGGGNQAAVVKVDVLAEMENVGERVGSVPGFGEVAVEIHLVVALEEAAEEQAVEVLGLRVGGETRIEVGGVGFEEKGEGGGIGI